MSFILRVLSKTQSVLGFILDLRFLPDKFQQWIFGTCTRAIEMLNSAVMLGFALVFQISAYSSESDGYRSDWYRASPALRCYLPIK